MEALQGREALRGAEEQTLDLIAEVLTSTQWAKLMRVPLERAAAKGNRGLAKKLVGAGAEMGDALQAAARGGHAEIVSDLVERGASVFAENAGGRTLLHVAAREGNAEMVLLLLQAGADVLVDPMDNDDWTPLCTAVRCGHMAAVLALLTRGADVNLRCGVRKMPVVSVAAKEAPVNILRTLIDHGADLEAVDVDGCTALHAAAWKNKGEAIDVLVEAGASVEAATLHGSTPLHCAAEEGSPQALAALLNHSAGVNTVNTRNISDRTPLHYAAALAGTRGAAGMVDLLLQSGADETVVDNEGTRAGDIIGDWVAEGYSLDEDVDRVRELLAKAPADRAWRRRGYLVLCRARPDRLRQRQDTDNNVRAAADGRTRDGAKLARSEESDGDETMCDFSRVKEAAGGGWADVLARVLELREDGIFRKIVGYL